MKMDHFKLISSTKASDVIPINKYVSEKSGITVIIANVGGPLVNGYFCLATEAHDDDGLPHTLEHLIFLGSKRYPYKGILDVLANRCMAHGTNAWTDTDHTCYTIETAGDAGMLTLLPIYLDHILNPTLTDEGFVTEVHHIDGNGEDAGVVYCEMQGRENDADSRCELKLLRAMYPDSGYSSETGGIMKNLRDSTDNIKVRNYHKKFYRPENLTIVLTGQIEAADVFRALEIVENDIVAKRQEEKPEEWSKPWTTLPPPPKYGELNEQWPADTEDNGQVLFGWRGPTLTDANGLKELTACALLLRYLCDTAAAPLQRRLVEREDALAGDVSYNLIENLSSLVKIELDNVPVGKLQLAKTEAIECLKTVRSGDEPIDMERLKRLVKKQLRESLASLESDPHSAVAFRCIGDSLYSQGESHFIARMNPQLHLNELLNESPDYWLSILQKYFTEDIVTIVGSPSVDLQTRMAEEEKTRIETQRSRLGHDGLFKKAEKLKAAMEFNERPPPSGTLASVPVPSCNFKCYNMASWHSGGEPCPHFNLDEVPIYTRAHSLATNFVYINLVLDTTDVNEKTRKWLPLQLNGLAECPVREGNDLIPHEEVISLTERLTVMFSNNIGFGRPGCFSTGQYGNFVHIETRCEPQDYEEVVNLLYKVLYAPEITKERLLVFAQRMINVVAQVRRKGDRMSTDILRDALYETDTNLHWSSVLRQQKFLKELIEQLNASEKSAQNVLNDAKETLSNITQKAWLHIATDFERYKLSTEPWKKFARSAVDCASSKPEPQLYLDASLIPSDRWGGGFVVGCGGVESCFLAQMSPGPLGFDLNEIAPLNLALSYFTQLEGPMWRLIRGGGLTYSYGVDHIPSEGRIMLKLYRSTNAVEAYSKAKSIMEEYLQSGKFDPDLFASARSTTIFNAVQLEKSPAYVVKLSLLNYLKRLDQCFNSELVCALASTTPQQAHEAAVKWLPLLFDQDQSKLSVICHPSKVNDLQAAFEKINIPLNAFESIEASHFSL